MKIHIIIALTLSTLMGCENNSDSGDSYVYFGGEIINPNNDYVVLIRPDDIADTLYLNESNRFLKKISPMKAGIYTLSHGSEYQRILLEPSDSILVRLNTIDFDESMVFTGDGARKNNFLIASFLENEGDNKKFMSMMWDMEPSKFEDTLNVNRGKKLKALDSFLSQNTYSELFKTIAETTINYDYYYNKELYPFGYYGYNNLIHYKDLPEQFYDFRTEVDYNNDALSGVIPYYRFLFYHFNNLALAKYYENATHNVVFDNKSVTYNLEKLRLMDSLISNDNIKNHLLKYTTRDFITFSNDSTEIDEMLTSYVAKSNSETDKKYIRSLANSVNKLKPGNELPSIDLYNYDYEAVNLSSLISRPTVIYFWSSNLPFLLRNSHHKVRALKSKFPDMDFIAININNNDRSAWTSILSQYKISPTNEYQFKDPSGAMGHLAINSVNRSIFVDADGKIINSNAMLLNSEFEEELQSYMQKKSPLNK